MALLDALLGGLGGQGSGPKPFKRTLTEADFFSVDVSITVSKWNVIGEKVVPAQQQLAWGYGDEEHPANQGYLYISIKDNAGTPVQLEGLVRLAQANANETNVVIIAEHRTEDIRGSKTDRDLKIPLPEATDYPLVGEDSKLQLLFYPDNVGAGVAGIDECEFLLPVSVYQ
jgi:hypothetical protein